MALSKKEYINDYIIEQRLQQIMMV